MKRRPNIVVTIADDQRHDTIAALGNGVVRTPHLDRMAARGLCFTRAHHMGSLIEAVCAPSRAMLHTGRNVFDLPEHLMGGRGADTHPLPFLPQLLRGHGYHCHGVGKWHNGKPSFARSFDGGANIFFGGMWDHDRVPVQDFDPTGEYAPERSFVAEGYSSDIFADSAVGFLNDYRGEEPFYLYVAFTAPHDPRTPPPHYAAMYRPEDMPLPPNYLPQHPFDNGELAVRDELLEAFPREPGAIRRHIADYYGMVTHMDAGIGRIHAALEQNGLLENTIVVHTADHGLGLGSHGLMGKQNPYDPSLRVPLLMQGPGIGAGQTNDALCYQHDLFPTLLQSAGVTAPQENCFHSLWPLLNGQRARTWDNLFWAYKDFQRVVKDDRYKLIEYYPPAERFTQLFDLQSDPNELHNLATETAYQPIVARLRALLHHRQVELGDPLAA